MGSAKKSEEALDPTRHITRSVAAIFCTLFVSMTAYYTVVAIVDPNTCSSDIRGMQSDCFGQLGGDDKACLDTAVEMMKICAQSSRHQD